MEEKKSKLSIAVVLLVLAIIVIIVLAAGMYKMYGDKRASNDKNAELNSKVNDLSTEIGELKDQISALNQEKSEEEKDSDKIDSNSNNDSVTLGKYNLNETNTERDGNYYKDCGIQIKENNEFYINVGEGFGYSGKYKIENNKLICQAEIYSGEHIESKSTDIVFSFEIVDKNTLKIIKIDINDKEQSDSIFAGCFEIGMTYSKSNSDGLPSNDEVKSIIQKYFSDEIDSTHITTKIENVELKKEENNKYIYNVYRTVNGDGDIHHDYQLVTIVKENGKYVVEGYELNKDYDYTYW